jgi:hypothetical protein
MRVLRARASRMAVVLALASSGCATPDPNATTLLAGPDRSSFAPVQAFLDHRCGTLDCHGTRYRNLRLWGHDGMRLAFGDVPGASPTTSAEIDASYSAIVALEPEVMDAVVADHGANPERLTFVRKARGTEKHAGGAILAEGDVRDICITSWLADQTDETACAAALVYP